MSELQELLDTYEKSKPQDTDFRQQRLRSWQPLLIPRNIILTFIVLGCIFLPIGIVIWDSSNRIHEFEVRYDDKPCLTPAPLCAKQVSIPITEDIPSPVYVYYKMTNFYQNHRRYIKSRSDSLMNGDLGASLSTCDPRERWDEKKLYPCGLVATSYFNDTVSATLLLEGETLPILLPEWTEKGISWKVDRDRKYEEKFPGLEDLPAESGFTRKGPNGILPELTNEHFMNWMRSAPFPSFRKLYAYINRDLKKGSTLIIDINDNFNSRQSDSTKSIIISNATWLGGKNSILGWLYIGCGAFCFFMAFVVALKQAICPRKLGRMAENAKLRDVTGTN